MQGSSRVNGTQLGKTIGKLLLSGLLCALVLAGCGGGGGGSGGSGGGGGGSGGTPTVTSVTVAPSMASVPVGQTQQYTATVQGTGNVSTAVTWLVNNIPGGNATLGSISATGLYTAPGTVPTPNPVTVTAVSVADSTKSGSAQVTVQSLPTTTVRIEGTVLDNPIANAVCLLVDRNGRTLASTTADTNGGYRFDVNPGMSGFVECSPQGLVNLQLATFVSTVGQLSGTSLHEDVTPTTTAIVHLIRGTNSTDPQATKTQILAALRAQDGNALLLVDGVTSLFSTLLTARINTDLDTALSDLLDDGHLNRADLRGVDAQVQAQRQRMGDLALAFAVLATNAVASSGAPPDSGDEGSGGGDPADSGPGASDGGGVGGSADDGAEGSPLSFAVCRFVDLDGNPVNDEQGRPLRTIANARGQFFLRVPQNTPGFVQCSPPNLAQLTIATFVRARMPGEKIRKQAVQPQTTVVGNIVQTFHQVDPGADLQALKEERMAAIGTEADISVLADSARDLYVPMLHTRINFDFQNALTDVLRDGQANAPELQPIAVQVNAQVARNETQRGVTVRFASTTGNIHGTVVEQVSQRPVPGVTVVATQNGQEVGRATSDATGQLTIPDISTGSDPFGTINIELSTASTPQPITAIVVAVASVEATIPVLLREPGTIAVERDGNLLVVDQRSASVISNSIDRIDPRTGNLTIVSDANTGNGPVGLFGAIAVEADGHIVAAIFNVDPMSSLPINSAAIVRVDQHTGDRTVVSDARIGHGTLWNDITSSGPYTGAIAVEADGNIVVPDLIFDGDRTVGRILRVHPHTGDRTVVSGCTELDPSGHCVGTIRGSGPVILGEPLGIAVERDGNIVVLGDFPTGGAGIFRVDPRSGDRTMVSQTFGFYLAIEPDGNLVVTGFNTTPNTTSIVRVDPRSGHQTIVSCADGNGCVPRGNGFPWREPTSIAVEGDGSLVVADWARTAVVRVNPRTGDRTLVYGIFVGNGPFFQAVAGKVLAGQDRNLLVVNTTFSGEERVFRVDPHTGDRTVVSDATTGLGPPLMDTQVATLDANGDLLILGQNVVWSFGGNGNAVTVGPGRVIRVDLRTGNRTLVAPLDGGIAFQGIAVEANGSLVLTEPEQRFARVVRLSPRGDLTVVSGCSQALDSNDRCSGSIIGSGPLFPTRTALGTSFMYIVVEADGTLIVATPQAILRVDPHTGDRTLVSPNDTFVIALAADGNLVAPQASGGIARVDPRTGSRSVVSDARRGSGPFPLFSYSIAGEADGSIVVFDSVLHALIRVDPRTGDRTIISK